jgi:flagellar biogenesis protein FliO
MEAFIVGIGFVIFLLVWGFVKFVNYLHSRNKTKPIKATNKRVAGVLSKIQSITTINVVAETVFLFLTIAFPTNNFLFYYFIALVVFNGVLAIATFFIKDKDFPLYILFQAPIMIPITICRLDGVNHAMSYSSFFRNYGIVVASIIALIILVSYLIVVRFNKKHGPVFKISFITIELLNTLFVISLPLITNQAFYHVFAS